MQPPSRNGESPKTVFERRERRAKELNAFLIVLAIGLAALDATCFAALKLSTFYSGLLATQSEDSAVAGGRR